MTPSDTVDDDGDLNTDVAAALDAYTERGLETVYVLGGRAAVGEDVVAAIKASYDVAVERVAGRDRFATAATIATRFGGETSTVLVADGGDFPDALVAGALSAAGSIPLLLTGADGPLDPHARRAIEELGARTVLLVGGQRALSTDIEEELRGLATVDVVTRLAGPSRVETAVELARYGEAVGLFPGAHLNLAFAYDFPDALTLGPHAGLEVGGAAPILLTDAGALPDAPGFTRYLQSRDACVAPVHVAGGLEAVAEPTLTALRRALTTDVGGELCFLQLLPETQSVSTGEDATVTVTGTDNLGDPPRAPTTVTLTTETAGADGDGVPLATGEVRLDERGEATFSFTSAAAGPTVVTATSTPSG